MTPMDSIRYYKHFLRAGFMSMNPHNGHVKAYVGGPNHHYFKYDMAMVGRRQVGSTILMSITSTTAIRTMDTRCFWSHQKTPIPVCVLR